MNSDESLLNDEIFAAVTGKEIVLTKNTKKIMPGYLDKLV
jgi:hypothetical protein